MLPWWSKSSLSVYLAPGCLALAEQGAGWNQPPRALHTLERTDDGWMAAILQLEDWLAQHQHGRQLQVILSCHFYRCLLLPWNPQLTSTATQASLSHAFFNRLYAPAQAEHQYFISNTPHFRQPQLVVAWEQGLQHALYALATRQHMRLSLTPSLSVIWNRFQPSQDLLLIEQDRVLWTRQQHGHLQEIQTGPLLPTALPSLSQAAVFGKPEHLVLPSNWQALAPTTQDAPADHPMQYACCGGPL